MQILVLCGMVSIYTHDDSQGADQTQKKLTKSSTAIKKLRAIFDNGEVTPKTSALSIWESDPVFFTKIITCLLSELD